MPVLTENTDQSIRLVPWVLSGMFYMHSPASRRPLGGGNVSRSHTDPQYNFAVNKIISAGNGISRQSSMWPSGTTASLRGGIAVGRHDETTIAVGHSPENSGNAADEWHSTNFAVPVDTWIIFVLGDSSFWWRTEGSTTGWAEHALGNAVTGHAGGHYSFLAFGNAAGGSMGNHGDYRSLTHGLAALSVPDAEPGTVDRVKDAWDVLGA